MEHSGDGKLKKEGVRLHTEWLLDLESLLEGGKVGVEQIKSRFYWSLNMSLSNYARNETIIQLLELKVEMITLRLKIGRLLDVINFLLDFMPSQRVRILSAGLTNC
jgi:hypothetical protein